MGRLDGFLIFWWMLMFTTVRYDDTSVRHFGHELESWPSLIFARTRIIWGQTNFGSNFVQ